MQHLLNMIAVARLALATNDHDEAARLVASFYPLVGVVTAVESAEAQALVAEVEGELHRATGQHGRAASSRAQAERWLAEVERLKQA